MNLFCADGVKLHPLICITPQIVISVASFSGPSSEMSSEKGDNLDSRVVETLIIPSETTSMNSVTLSSSPQNVSVENVIISQLFDG
ncbi:unnamed protein product [Anisakis simplex]|uniref:Ovule protein n=1 Tax=Anisakis simplex TaxID=6269 RepID=A0A0M3JNT3_ANISI|nr:unnamed protein product [Anisakis simplex]